MDRIRSVDLTTEYSGKILICQGAPDREFIHKAIFLGIAGLVVPGLHYRDLKSVDPVELTIVMLGRFGNQQFETRDWTQLSSLNGKKIGISRLDDQHFDVSFNS